MTRRIAALTAVAVFLCLGSDVFAQTRNSSSSSQTGMFGDRTLGQSLTPGTRTFGQNPMQQAGSGLQGNVGGIDTSDRFLRENRRPGDFVGADPGDVQDFVGAVQAADNQQQGRSAVPTGGQRGSDPNLGSNRRTPTAIRARLSIGFASLRPTSMPDAAALEARLERCPRLKFIGGLELSMDGNTAILRGKVTNDDDRRMAEQMLSLEPGVWQIKNELVVETR